jgi:SAM-dependent methyltransferase
MDNAKMIEVWDGEVGRFWVAEQERYARMHAGFTKQLLAVAGPQPGERVLEVGCGFGNFALDLGRATGPSGAVLGVDVSGPMLEVAAARARDLPQVAFLRADAQHADLSPSALDAVISQFGVMFFADHAEAFRNISKALRPGGRLVFTCWQDMAKQPRLMIPVVAALEHIPPPEFDESFWGLAAFSLADPATIEGLLSGAGFTDVSIEPVVAAEYQGANVADTISFMRQSDFGQVLFASADPASAARGWDAVATALAEHQAPDGVYLDGAAWLVTARAPAS